jgi:hypothetical protein
MSLTREVERENWVEFLSLLSNGNRGRLIRIEVGDPSAGDEELAAALPLYAIDYDPVGKGNDLVISTGADAQTYSHTVDAPVEIRQLQEESGKVSLLEIVDQNGVRTVITFKS